MRLKLMYVHHAVPIKAVLTGLQMNKYLPQAVLTPDGIKTMWGYMRVFYCNQHWSLKSRRRIRSMTASTRRSRCLTAALREEDYDDDDKDSDVDQPMDDEVSRVVLLF